MTKKTYLDEVQTNESGLVDLTNTAIQNLLKDDGAEDSVLRNSYQRVIQQTNERAVVASAFTN